MERASNSDVDRIRSLPIYHYSMHRRRWRQHVTKLFCACFDISITALSLLPQAQIVCLLGYEHTKQAQQAQNFNKHISYFS